MVWSSAAFFLVFTSSFTSVLANDNDMEIDPSILRLPLAGRQWSKLLGEREKKGAVLAIYSFSF